MELLQGQLARLLRTVSHEYYTKVELVGTGSLFNRISNTNFNPLLIDV